MQWNFFNFLSWFRMLSYIVNSCLQITLVSFSKISLSINILTQSNMLAITRHYVFVQRKIWSISYSICVTRRLIASLNTSYIISLRIVMVFKGYLKIYLFIWLVDLIICNCMTYQICLNYILFILNWLFFFQ